MYLNIAVISVLAALSKAIELTFELPDNANQCFFEVIEKGTESTIEFQVVTGGQYDVDMTLEGPSGQILYKDVRKQYDSHTWKAEVSGEYKVCFSNEFSTFSHKIVYIDWLVGEEKPIIPSMEHQASAMTVMESSSQDIHERLKTIDDYQTHHRLREATGRRRAEDLNERVLWWSMGQACVILVIGIGQLIPGLGCLVGHILGEWFLALSHSVFTLACLWPTINKSYKVKCLNWGPDFGEYPYCTYTSPWAYFCFLLYSGLTLEIFILFCR